MCPEETGCLGACPLYGCEKPTKKREDTLNDKPRRPWIAALLTIFITGLGHLYSGKPLRGMILFFIGQFLFIVFAVAVNIITPNVFFVLPAVVVGIAFIVFCVVDVISIAKRKKANYELAKYNRWFVYIGCIFAALLVLNIYKYFVIIPYFIQAYKLPTGAMEPALLIGDHFLVGKLIFKTTEPKRGDIIIFKYPKDPNVDSLKRLIGEPGEKVEIIERTVYINGKPLKEDYVQYIDPGSAHQHYGPISVPPECYFVLGDNRDNSADSRFWGCVPRENLLGKPLFIYWSFKTPRDEYLKTDISDRQRHFADRFFNFFTKTRWRRTFQVIK
jgi:signal peptidase I